MEKKSEPGRLAAVSIPVRMPAELKARVDAASEATSLAQQDVIRLSLDRGIDILLAQLGANKPSAAPVAVGA